MRICHQPCSWLKGLRRVIDDFSRNDTRPWQKWLSVNIVCFVRKKGIKTHISSPIFHSVNANRNVARPPQNMFLFPKVQVDLSTLADRRTITTTVIPYMVWNRQKNPPTHFMVLLVPGRLMDLEWRDKLLQKLCNRKRGSKLATFHFLLFVSVKEQFVSTSPFSKCSCYTMYKL